MEYYGTPAQTEGMVDGLCRLKLKDDWSVRGDMLRTGIAEIRQLRELMTALGVCQG